MDKKQIRDNLPVNSQASFDGIINGMILGASNHIRLIAKMFIDIAENNTEEQSIKMIKEVSNFFKETRGKSSYAIVTALNIVENNIENSHAPNYVERISEGVNKYFSDANANVDKMLNYSYKLLEKANCVMLFDYSSSVEKAIVGSKHQLKVYIPESRVINGGYPFVKKIVEANHHVCFISDAAMLSVLQEVDMAFIGVETFYADGTAFNTVGSDILALLCYFYHIPYYVITPLLKADVRAIYGDYKEVITSDLKNILANNWEKALTDKVDFRSIELVGIEPQYISGYVTEKGILKPSALFQFVYKEGVAKYE